MAKPVSLFVGFDNNDTWTLYPVSIERNLYANRVTIEAIPLQDKPHAKKTSMQPQKVIFNPPATIVYWSDGTKTVVKCDSKDTYSKQAGLALCYMKKALGNTSRALNDALRVAEGQCSESLKREEE